MPNLFKPAVEVGKISTVCPDILDPSVKDTIKRKFRNVTAVSLAKTVFLHGTRYTQGMFLSTGSTTSWFWEICKYANCWKRALFCCGTINSSVHGPLEMLWALQNCLSSNQRSSTTTSPCQRIWFKTDFWLLLKRFCCTEVGLNQHLSYSFNKTPKCWPF